MLLDAAGTHEGKGLRGEPAQRAERPASEDPGTWTFGQCQRRLGPPHPVSGPSAPKSSRRRAVLEGQGSSARVPELSPDSSRPSAQVLFALNQTLLQQESVRAGSLQAPYTTEDLIKHYNCGDLNAVIFNHDTSQVGSPPLALAPPGHPFHSQAQRKVFIRRPLCARRRCSSLQPR